MGPHFLDRASGFQVGGGWPPGVSEKGLVRSMNCSGSWPWDRIIVTVIPEMWNMDLG